MFSSKSLAFALVAGCDAMLSSFLTGPGRQAGTNMLRRGSAPASNVIRRVQSRAPLPNVNVPLRQGLSISAFGNRSQQAIESSSIPIGDYVYNVGIGLLMGGMVYSAWSNVDPDKHVRPRYEEFIKKNSVDGKTVPLELFLPFARNEIIDRAGRRVPEEVIGEFLASSSDVSGIFDFTGEKKEAWRNLDGKVVELAKRAKNGEFEAAMVQYYEAVFPDWPRKRELISEFFKAWKVKMEKEVKIKINEHPRASTREIIDKVVGCSDAHRQLYFLSNVRNATDDPEFTEEALLCYDQYEDEMRQVVHELCRIFKA